MRAGVQGRKQWDASVNTKVHELLKDVARAGVCATYAEIGNPLDLDMAVPADREALSAMLDEVNQYEHAQGAPLLSSVVVSAGSKIPGSGYFLCARKLGLHNDGDDDRKFWNDEVGRVHAWWKYR